MMTGQQTAEIQLSQETITPEQATFLVAGVDFSSTKLKVVEAYAEDMRNRRWKLNGDSIIFDKDGKIVQGHLRLKACSVSNVPFETVIVRGVDTEARTFAGSHRRRSIATTLQIRGVPRANALAGAIRSLWQISNNVYGSAVKPHEQVIHQFLNEYPEIAEGSDPKSSIHMGYRMFKEKLMSQSQGITIHFLLTKLTDIPTERFFETLITGESTLEKDPVLILRTALQNMPKTGGRDRTIVMDYVMMAWKAYCQNKTITKLQRSKAVPWVFPKITGINGGDIDFGKEIVEKTSIAPFSTASGKLKIRLARITPAFAAQLLRDNNKNRKASDEVVEMYARDMRNGSFVLTGDTIKLSSRGRLLDGQHRLKAAVKSSTDFDTVIVENVDEEAFDTFDLGKPRRFRDTLNENGHAYVDATSAALKIIINGERGLTTRMFHTGVSNAELEDAAEGRHKNIFKYVHIAKDAKHMGLHPGLSVALYYLCAKADPIAAKTFFEDCLRDKVGLYIGHPAQVLYQKMINMKKGEAGSIDKYVWTIKAWNYFRTDTKITALNLRWRNTAEMRDPIPAII
jgi:hypothetical protein